MKIKKGDQIKVMAGKDKGKIGKVERVYLKQKKILVLGVNIYKKHIKKNEKLPQGGVVELPRPIDVAKVMLVCSRCQKPTRIGYQVSGNKKFRFCRKCDEKI